MLALDDLFAELLDRRVHLDGLLDYFLRALHNIERGQLRHRLTLRHRVVKDASRLLRANDWPARVLPRLDVRERVALLGQEFDALYVSRVRLFRLQSPLELRLEFKSAFLGLL